MKTFFIFLFSFLATSAVHAQVDLRVIADRKDLRADQELKLTIILEIQGNDFNIQSPIQLPDLSKFNILATGSENSTDLNARTKTIIYQLLLAPKQSGKIKIGSALYSTNDKIYKTEPFDIMVSEGSRRASAPATFTDDVYLDLEIKNPTVYKNQPTVAVLKAYSRNFNLFRNLSDIKFPKSSHFNIHPISFKKSDIEQHQRSKMASQVIATFLISAPESGQIELPPVSAVIKNNSSEEVLKSNKVSLNVKKLPKNSPATYKDAVGNFSVKLKSSVAEENKVGEAVNVDLVVSGEGNLRRLTLPKILPSDNYTIFPPKVTYHIHSSQKGSVGEVIAKYVLIPKKSGKIAINTEGFSFFNPDLESYQNAAIDSLNFIAHSPEEVVANKSTLDKVNDYTSNVIATVNAPKILPDELKLKNSTKVDYKVILGNLALVAGFGALLFVFFRKKQKKTRNVKNTKQVETIREAEARLREDEKIDFDAELLYLEKIKNSEEPRAFFSAFDAFLEELQQFTKSRYNLTFTQYLVEKKGAKIAEDFRNLRQAIEMEKFAPILSPTNLDSIFNQLNKLILEIKE